MNFQTGQDVWGLNDAKTTVIDCHNHLSYLVFHETPLHYLFLFRPEITT